MADEPRPRIVVKKKGGHGAHHGGAWKVAYADFVTAMMALFMVLWLLTQADLKLRQQIAQYFRNPGVLVGGAMINAEMNESRSREPKVISMDVTVVSGDAEEELLQNRLREIEEIIEQKATEDPVLGEIKDQVLVQVTEQGLSIQVIDKGRTMLFDVSSAELKPPVVKLLSSIAGMLGSMPNPIWIGGHTDSRPYPSASAMTNWELSFRRADAARRILEANGLRRGQVERVQSYADSEPVIPENPLADENRRLSILAVRTQAPPPTPTAAPGEEPVVLPPDPLPGTTAAVPVG
ncbi:MAG: OmpA family protein [bacterium]|nr:OmpA family protein [bacterium]